MSYLGTILIYAQIHYERQRLAFALTAVCRGFSHGDQRLLGGKHQDKRKILLGSTLAPAQASASSGPTAGQRQLPPLLRLMMLLTLSSR